MTEIQSLKFRGMSGTPTFDEKYSRSAHSASYFLSRIELDHGVSSLAVKVVRHERWSSEGKFTKDYIFPK